MLNAEK